MSQITFYGTVKSEVEIITFNLPTFDLSRSKHRGPVPIEASGLIVRRTALFIIVMPEQSPQVMPEAFSSPEEEIAALERRLAEKRAALLTEEEKQLEEEPKPSAEEEKKALREEVAQHIREVPHPSHPVSDDASGTLQGQPQAQKITMLLELALDKGPVHAVQVAEQLDEPYLLDRLHDELVNHFYQKLLEKEEKLKDL